MRERIEALFLILFLVAWVSLSCMIFQDLATVQPNVLKILQGGAK